MKIVQSNARIQEPTIYEALKARLGREPTQNEINDDVLRILREGREERAARGRR